MIACLICGKEFRDLAVHLGKTHKLTAVQYRAMFRLPVNSPVHAEGYLAEHEAKYVKRGRMPDRAHWATGVEAIEERAQWKKRDELRQKSEQLRLEPKLAGGPYYPLYGGPYIPPKIAKGDWLDDVIDGRVQVGGYSEAQIRWPRRLKAGKTSLILCGDLVRAVRSESAEAIQFWFGVGAVTAWKWRKALGVTRQNNHGTQVLYKGIKAGKLTPGATQKGRQNALNPESIEKMRKTKLGKPVQPHVREALLRAAKAPKPPGWGKRANEWMQAAKKRSADDPPA